MDKSLPAPGRSLVLRLVDLVRGTPVIELDPEARSISPDSEDRRPAWFGLDDLLV
jgi:hypothetical protein